MNMMSLLRTGLILTLLSGTALALPRGYSPNAKDYLESNSDLSRWSCGLYSEGRERDVWVDPYLVTMATTKVMAYVGYDIRPWVTCYLVGGGASTQLGTDRKESASEIGAGLKFNLFDHEIMDPTLFEDRLRVNAGLQYSSSEATWGGRDLSYQELSGSLTLSILNDIQANILFSPKAIGIFAGAIYSDLFGGDIDEDATMGYTAGAEIFYTERVVLEIRMEGFDEVRYMGGVHVRL